MGEMIDIAALSGEGSFKAYRANPASTPTAAIIVIQEVFGVNAGIRQKCDRLAEQGYLAIAPDLFWRIAPGVQLNPDVPEELQRGLDLFGQFDQDAGIRDIEATIHATRDLLGGTGKIGAVGYCLGGRLAFMTACRTDIDAAAGYYGVGIDGLLGEKHAIANPVVMHIAGDDGFVDKATQQKMHEGLDDHPKVTLYDYPGEDHGFATEMGDRRSPAAAELADQRTAAFFAQHLK
jgi:carboxymethylenebutenolidase